jgi:hypothetical protein
MAPTMTSGLGTRGALGAGGLGRAVNPKDIRETELYQESFPGSRVEANTLAGMPLTQTNVPSTEALLGPQRRLVTEDYTGHVH